MPQKGIWRVKRGEAATPYEVGGRYNLITVKCIKGEVEVTWITDNVDGIGKDGVLTRKIKGGNSEAVKARKVTIKGIDSSSNGDWTVAD